MLTWYLPAPPQELSWDFSFDYIKSPTHPIGPDLSTENLPPYVFDAFGVEWEIIV